MLCCVNTPQCFGCAAATALIALCTLPQTYQIENVIQQMDFWTAQLCFKGFFSCCQSTARLNPKTRTLPPAVRKSWSGVFLYFFLRLPCVSESRIAFRLLGQTTFGSVHVSLFESNTLHSCVVVFFIPFTGTSGGENLEVSFTVQLFHLHLLELSISWIYLHYMKQCSAARSCRTSPIDCLQFTGK